MLHKSGAAKNRRDRIIRSDLQETGDAVLEPWFPVILLVLESSEVVGLRVMKLAGGGVDAQHEARLMVNEKIDAAVEVGARLLCGGTAINVINRFREHVAANAERLSTERVAALGQE
jgi:hypothetical protein